MDEVGELRGGGVPGDGGVCETAGSVDETDGGHFIVWTGVDEERKRGLLRV